MTIHGMVLLYIEVIEQLEKYIKWYAEKRIKLSLGGLSPLDYRRSLGRPFDGPKMSAPPSEELCLQKTTIQVYTLPTLPALGLSLDSRTLQGL